MKIGKVTFKIWTTGVLSSVRIKVSVICKKKMMVHHRNIEKCVMDRNELNVLNYILFCFSDMLRGGLHLRKTLLQQWTGLQECSESTFKHQLTDHSSRGVALKNLPPFSTLFSDLLAWCLLHVLTSDLLQQYLYAGEHLDLTAMMNTWTLQKGIPLVTVTRKGPRLLLRQDRFLRTVMPSDPLWSTLQKGWACTWTRTVFLVDLFYLLTFKSYSVIIKNFSFRFYLFEVILSLQL